MMRRAKTPLPAGKPGDEAVVVQDGRLGQKKAAQRVGARFGKAPYLARLSGRCAQRYIR
jgi:hypothetical protein